MKSGSKHYFWTSNPIGTPTIHYPDQVVCLFKQVHFGNLLPSEVAALVEDRTPPKAAVPQSLKLKMQRIGGKIRFEWNSDDSLSRSGAVFIQAGTFRLFPTIWSCSVSWRQAAEGGRRPWLSKLKCKNTGGKTRYDTFFRNITAYRFRMLLLNFSLDPDISKLISSLISIFITFFLTIRYCIVTWEEATEGGRSVSLKLKCKQYLVKRDVILVFTGHRPRESTIKH